MGDNDKENEATTVLKYLQPKIILIKGSIAF